MVSTGAHVSRGISMALHLARSSGMVVIVSLVLIEPLRAQLSPGKLSEPHADLEGLRACTSCHELGEGVQPSRCLGCHEVLRARVDAGQGLHAQPGYDDCVACHSEHHGRDFELIWWKDGVEAFDHGLTGHALEGAHSTRTCRDCHTPSRLVDRVTLLEHGVNLERTYLGLSTACAGCHNDVHAGRLGDDCTSCHTQATWTPAPGFSHATTRFPLTGKHVDATCASCHAPKGGEPVYVGLEFGTCASCHTDVHAGKLGGDCTSCHTTTSWRSTKGEFDHDRTRYPLAGKHAGVTCAGCHGEGLARRTPAFAACRDCHGEAHGDQLADRADGGACESCHTVEGFRPALFALDEHDRCAYPLEGAHQAVPCQSCHVRGRSSGSSSGGTSAWIFDIAADACSRCHADAHAASARVGDTVLRCEDCHALTSWAAVAFDHGKTRFALPGRHAVASCRGCHAAAHDEPTGRVTFARRVERCESCHADPHAGQFSVELTPGRVETACERCHATASWSADLFDHMNEVRFALDGRHVAVPCASCHPTVTENGKTFTRYRPLPLTCEACHGPRPPEEAR
jgi:hypothetical protein